MTFVMLNPSTADANEDDATVRKCVGFGKRWGFDGLSIVNLYAYRSRHPSDLVLQADPVGPNNDIWIQRIASDPASTIIAAWGAHGELYGARVARVSQLIRRAMRCISQTKTGQPAHPLMLPYRLMPQPWATVGGGE